MYYDVISYRLSSCDVLSCLMATFYTACLSIMTYFHTSGLLLMSPVLRRFFIPPVCDVLSCIVTSFYTTCLWRPFIYYASLILYQWPVTSFHVLWRLLYTTWLWRPYMHPSMTSVHTGGLLLRVACFSTSFRTTCMRRPLMYYDVFSHCDVLSSIMTFFSLHIAYL